MTGHVVWVLVFKAILWEANNNYLLINILKVIAVRVDLLITQTQQGSGSGLTFLEMASSPAYLGNNSGMIGWQQSDNF